MTTSPYCFANEKVLLLSKGLVIGLNEDHPPEECAIAYFINAKISLTGTGGMLGHLA